MAKRNVQRFISICLLVGLVVAGAGCGDSDPVVVTQNGDPPPPPPPPPDPRYSGSYLHSPRIDHCGEVTLPSVFKVIVAGTQFLVTGVLRGEERTWASGSFNPSTLTGNGWGYRWCEWRPGRPLGTQCLTGIIVGAKLVFSDENHFRAEVRVGRSSDRPESCFQAPCDGVINITGPKFSTN